VRGLRDRTRWLRGPCICTRLKFPLYSAFRQSNQAAPSADRISVSRLDGAQSCTKALPNFLSWRPRFGSGFVRLIRYSATGQQHPLAAALVLHRTNARLDARRLDAEWSRSGTGGKARFNSQVFLAEAQMRRPRPSAMSLTLWSESKEARLASRTPRLPRLATTRSRCRDAWRRGWFVGRFSGSAIKCPRSRGVPGNGCYALPAAVDWVACCVAIQNRSAASRPANLMANLYTRSAIVSDGSLDR